MTRNFTEGCFFCGGDHRRFECPKLSAEMKAKGLRKVNGHWVAGNGGGAEAESEQGSEDLFYMNLLEESAGGKLEVLLRSASPPPPLPTDAAVVRTRRPAQKTHFAVCTHSTCGGECGASAGPLRAPRGGSRPIGGGAPQAVPPDPAVQEEHLATQKTFLETGAPLPPVRKLSPGGGAGALRGPRS